MALHLHALIKLLGQAHGLLGGEVQRLGGLLLQGTGGKGKRRLLAPLTVLHFTHHIGGVIKILQYLIQLLLLVDGDLPVLVTVKFGCKRLFASVLAKVRLQIPVFLRDKGIDLLLPVTDHPKGDGLHPAGA